MHPKSAGLKCIPFLFVLLSPWGVASADVHCDAQDTFDTCSAKLTGEMKKDGTEAKLKSGMKDSVAAKNTGSGATSNTNDFLPLLRALLDKGEGTGEGEKLGFEWSNPLGLPNKVQNKLVLSLEKSDVFEPLKTALRAASLDGRVGELKDGISESDDISMGYSFSLASEKAGRDPRLHEAMLSSLLAAAIPGAATDDSELNNFIKTRLRENNAERARNPAIRQMDFDLAVKDIGLNDADQKDYLRLVEASVQKHIKSMHALGDRLKALGLYGFLDLVNNQPQLSFSGTYRSRKDVVGPDEIRISAAYEKGWANVNDFRNYQSKSCAGQEETRCLAGYLEQPGVQEDLKRSARVTFKVDYSKISRIDYALPASTFTYSAKSTRRLSASAGFSRYVSGEVNGAKRTRLDASVAYEDFSDDPAHQDRGLATATLTYPASDGLFLSLGVVYATRPEYRGEVDKEISTRAGFVYKLVKED